MARVGSFVRDFFLERRTLQNQILFPFIVFSFLAIVVVVTLVVQILSQKIEIRTSRDILVYKEAVEAFFREKQRQTQHYGNLLASFKAAGSTTDRSPLNRSMDISHMDLLIKERVKIYMEPRRFLQGGNRQQRDMVARGLRGEAGSALIYKNRDGKVALDYDVVVPYERDGRPEIILVGFGLDDEYLREIKNKVKNDIFILHNDRIIASTFQDPTWRAKIERRVTPELLEQVLGRGEAQVKKVYLSGKEYKTVFAPLHGGGTSRAAFGLIMSTNDLAEAKRKVILNYLAVSLGIMVILTLINFFVIRAISRPLKEMAVLADRVAQGDLSRRIEVAAGDELSTLAESFNNMVDSLERQREELDRTIEQLIHQEKFASLGEMAAGVAHEVGNPLFIIVGYAKMLVRRCGDAEERELLIKITEAAQRIERLTRSLLLYARPSLQERESVDVNRVMDDALAMVEHRFKEERNYRMVKRLSPKVRPVTGSPDKLQQVFVNLLINAFQAMPEGGTLTVSTDNGDDGRSVVVELADTGVGIPSENLSKIFDPFFTTKAPDRGTGLGLSITQRIVTDHGGTIRVESTPGRGTRFTITLPAEPASGEPPES